MKKLLITALVVYIVGFALGFLFHGVLLKQDYQAVAGKMLPESEQMANMPLMLLGSVFWALGFVWLYSKGVENAPWAGQGIRFGLGVIALVTIPIGIWLYGGHGWPASLVVKGTLAEVIGNLVAALVTAYMYRSEAAAAPRSRTASA